ncbi:MAG TPA: LPS export ABC transporter periplasmic protein LptC [Xanthomonadaceae bacterium]|nr:LPS export ABC transporter periplasmic protein LptC [Xanthomonadaceae bacterium]
MNRRALLTAALVLTGAVASWGAWRLRPQPPPSEDVGPPRSDYTLDVYHLVVMNKQGKLSFVSNGPYMARNPNDESLNLNHPDFSFPDQASKGDWTAHSEAGWVSAKGDIVKLARAVKLDGPVVPGQNQAHLRTEQITVFPKQETAHTDLLVTATQGASILIGTGMNANLKTSYLELLSKVSLHDVPTKKH